MPRPAALHDPPLTTARRQPHGLARAQGGLEDLLAVMDTGTTLFFDHADPEWVTRLDSVRVD